MQEIVDRYIVQATSYFKEYAGLDTPKAELFKERSIHMSRLKDL